MCPIAGRLPLSFGMPCISFWWSAKANYLISIFNNWPRQTSYRFWTKPYKWKGKHATSRGPSVIIIIRSSNLHWSLTCRQWWANHFAQYSAWMSFVYNWFKLRWKVNEATGHTSAPRTLSMFFLAFCFGASKPIACLLDKVNKVDIYTRSHCGTKGGVVFQTLYIFFIVFSFSLGRYEHWALRSLFLFALLIILWQFICSQNKNGGSFDQTIAFHQFQQWHHFIACSSSSFHRIPSVFWSAIVFRRVDLVSNVHFDFKKTILANIEPPYELCPCIIF